ncbi:MAG: efflux RND transporter periplasmic adaptor subunit [Rubripirellula sp.]
MHFKSTRNTCLIALLVLSTGTSAAEELEAFTEPYNRVAIPAPEVGVIADITVSEGDEISHKQILAKLNDDVLQASLQVARAAKDALGSRQVAEADLEVRQRQLEIYRELHEHGNASQRELDRAETEHQQAASRLQSVREDLNVRHLEFERVKTQIKQRVIASPIQGYVVAIDKEVGEFVSPTDPVIMHIVHLKTLKAVFSVPFANAKTLRPGQMVKLTIGYDGIVCDGEIEFVSPVANPESGTAPVKVRIPNPKNLIPSGIACRWNMETETPVERTARHGSHFSR